MMKSSHITKRSRAVAFPIMLSNIPGNAVNGHSPALVRRLADLDPIVAVEESSGDWNNYCATATAVSDRLRVFCSPSSLFGVAATLLGADGLIDCFPNIWAPGGLDLFFKARDGDLEEARKLQATGAALTHLFASEGRTLYPSTKAAMHLLGLPGGTLLRPWDRDQMHGLRIGLERLGMLDKGRADAAE